MTCRSMPEALGNNGKRELCRLLYSDNGKGRLCARVLIPEDLTQRGQKLVFCPDSASSQGPPLPSGAEAGGEFQPPPLGSPQPSKKE